MSSAQYQKLSQLEHVIKRPDTYIGSVEMDETQMWVCDAEGKMHFRKVSMVPGLYKIFDEILVNAADNKVRDPSMTFIKVGIDPGANRITVQNDGKGIPIEKHDVEDMWIPELIFGNLLTSSNYNDDEQKVTGGRNGFGAKLCNIFSTKFEVNTADQNQEYTQVWTANMTQKQEPTIVKRTKKTPKSWTKISFEPDLEKFGMASLDNDIVEVMRRRVYDLAGTSAGLKVYLNDTLITIKDFNAYVQMFTSALDHEQQKVVYAKPNDRWEVAFGVSDGTFNQMSFVNSIATTSGGTHVNYVADQIINYLLESVKKKIGKKGASLKRAQIKSHMFLFVNCKINNPKFTSQTKEQMTTKMSQFGSKCELPAKFLKDVMDKTGIMDSLLSLSEKAADKLMAKQDGGKKRRLTGIVKLDDANKAGTKESSKCILVLTEGDSAKSLAVQGIEVVGRDYLGCYPLRGKMLNVREASQEQILKNKEISELKKIIGLQHKKHYTSTEGLRYGHIMIMTDQDHDGSHIKGLIINFLESSFPGLLDIPGFLLEFITPIIKVTILRNKKAVAVKNFFNTIEYETWRDTEGKTCKWTHKYFKGLGTSLKSDFREYFSNLDFHQKTFLNLQEGDKEKIELAFAKNRADDRKQWLQEYVPGTFLDPHLETIPIKEFIDKELVLFSLSDCARSIPSVMDGLKPSQRKVMFASFLRRPFVKEVKVAQLGADATSKAAYHHGEASIQQTIIGLAQDFIGSNNIYWLMPEGGFGSRATGGKDASAARYIHTLLNPVTKFAFQENDEPLLNYLQDDESTIEPEYYVPVLPTLLVNGGEGIGTGWSSNIPCFNPLDITANLRRMMAEQPLQAMTPWYRGWTGVIERVPGNDQQFRVCGRIEELDDNTLAITELPVRMWTENMKEFLLRSIIGSSKEAGEKGAKPLPEFIDDVTEEHGNGNVRFVVKLSDENMAAARQTGLYQKFKLVTPMSTANMVAFDPQGRLRRYKTAEDILKEFYYVRLDYYQRRKDYMTDELKNKLERLTSQARFIKLIIEKDLNINNKARKLLIKELERLRFPRFGPKGGKPVWPGEEAAAGVAGDDADSDDEEDIGAALEADPEVPNVTADGSVTKPLKVSYDYLLNMKISSLTKEKYERLLRDRDGVEEELNELLGKTIKSIWEHDLDKFEQEYQKFLDKDQHAREFTPGKKKAAKRKASDSDDDEEFGAKKRRKRAAPVKKEVIREGIYLEPPAIEEFKQAKPKVKKETEAKPKEPKAAKTAVKKEPKEPKEPAAKAATKAAKTAVKKEPSPAAPTAKLKQSKLSFAKKVDSDSESDAESELDLESVPVTRAPRARRAATKQSYTAPPIELDDDDSMMVDEPSDDSDDGKFELSD